MRHRLNVSVPLTSSIIKDLKVTSGLVFREYLEAYTHWGFGDNDVVYGDLRRVLSPEVLCHDVVDYCGEKCGSRLCGARCEQPRRRWLRPGEMCQSIVRCEIDHPRRLRLSLRDVCQSLVWS